MKSFTKIASALMLGGIAFAANAASLVAPTVTPTSGLYGAGDYTTVTLQWISAGDTIPVTQAGKNLNASLYVDGQLFNTIAGVLVDQVPEEEETTTPATRADEGTAETTPEETPVYYYTLKYYLTASLGTEGNYELQIPAGLVKDEKGNTSTAVNLTYDIMNTASCISITPATGTYAVDDLSDLSINCIDGFVWYEGMNNGSRVLGPSGCLDANGNPLVITLTQAVPGEEDPIVVTTFTYNDLTLNDNATGFVGLDLSNYVENDADYPYTLTIPANFFIIRGYQTYSDNYTDYLNNEYAVTYTIWDGMNNGAFILNYSSWNPAGMLEAPVVELAWGSTYNQSPIYPSSLAYSATLYKVVEDADDDEETEGVEEQTEWTIPAKYFSLHGTVLSIDLASFFADNKLGLGEYYIGIPQGIVQDGKGQINTRQIFEYQTFKINEAYPYPAVVEGPDADDNIIITWKNVSGISAVNSYPYYFYDIDSPMVMTPEENEAYPIWGYIYEEEYPYNEIAVKVNVAEVVTTYGNGDYTLTIPEGFFVLSEATPEVDEDAEVPEVVTNALSLEIVYSFTYTDGALTGVDTIGATVENNVVYNLQGVKVMEGKDLNGLANGIYIINGKKVMIRK